MSNAPAPPPPNLVKHSEELELQLQANLNADGALGAACRYVMGWEDADHKVTSQGGKRIRPALCLYVAELFGGNIVDALPGALAIELVHNFSLVHDEIQDQDPERHHRKTIWRIIGEAQAINVGDYLYIQAQRVLIEAAIPENRRLLALASLANATGDMIKGQWTDLSFENRNNITVDEYLEMIEFKTGALIGAAIECGAVLAGVPKAEADLGRAWGRRIGLAFQAHDDILGIWGDPNTTGKSNVNDLMRKKKSLPVIEALKQTKTATLIESLYAADKEPTPEEIFEIADLLEKNGIRKRCEEHAQRFVGEAEEILEALPLGVEERARLRQIADYLIKRNV
jgi:geranylgeranyl diphosphate synthase type I